MLACAIEDVEHDLEEARRIEDYRQAIDWLLDAARPLVREQRA
jgi:hypothetical protein